MKKLVFIVAGVLLFLSLFLLYSKMGSNINVLAKVQGQIYINNNFGFSLTFPESWNGNYIIKDDKDFITISFMGKSKVSQGLAGSKEGLSMFYIGTENYVRSTEFIDSVRKIGKARNVNYYYFTDTDYPVGVLTDYLQDQLMDIKEKSLMKKDYIKAKAMEKEINSVLSTFKPIEISQ